VAFKPNTDDVREAAAIDLIFRLQAEGAEVSAYDPVATQNAAAVTEGVDFAHDAYGAAQNADAIVLVTEWNEFKNLDLHRLKNVMRQPILIDGRNLYEPDVLKAVGFDYLGVARAGSSPVEIAIQQQAALRD
jgi:UDPglucose 6-dehydrogenase